MSPAPIRKSTKHFNPLLVAARYREVFRIGILYEARLPLSWYRGRKKKHLTCVDLCEGWQHQRPVEMKHLSLELVKASPHAVATT